MQKLTVALLLCCSAQWATAGDWESAEVDSLVAQTSNLLKENNDELALSVGQELIRKHPDKPEAYIHLASVYLRITMKHEFDYRDQGLALCDSASSYMAASEAVPLEARHRLAYLFKYWEDWKAALRQYEAILATDSTDVVSQQGAATSLQKLGRFEDAKVYFNKMRQRIPRDDPSLLDSPVPDKGSSDSDGRSS